MPASPFDPMGRLDPGEEHFLIREKDPVGPAAITGWTHLRRNWALRRYGTEPTGDAKRLLDAELVQCKEAEEKALAWSERQAGHEPVAEHRAGYVEVKQSEEQLAAARRQKLVDNLDRHLAEADCAIHELLALDGPTASTALAEQAERLHELALGVKFGAEAKAA